MEKQISKKENNYAFIDGQNLYYRTKDLDWDFDYARFRIYLKDKYSTQKAFIFIGYIKSNEDLYGELRSFGYELIFKEVSKDSRGKIKGNVDVDLTLHSLIKILEYDKAVLVTSDGDFSPLVEYLSELKKFKTTMSVSRKNCSYLLKKSSKGYIRYIEDIRKVVEKRKSAPRD